MEEKRHCLSCGKKLTKMGLGLKPRKNGCTYHNDWDARKYHLKCWKKNEAEEKKKDIEDYAEYFRDLCKSQNTYRPCYYNEDGDKFRYLSELKI